MDETKQQQPANSSAPIQIATLESPPGAPRTAEPSGTDLASLFSRQGLNTRLSRSLEVARNLRFSSFEELAGFLKRTRRLWLTAAGVVFGLMALVIVVGRVAEWTRNTRERRHELAVATVTPDRLVARCGEAVEDATKEVYPILMRTMRYQARGNQELVLAFSRTAEQQSDWVFLSMNDESGSPSYDTPDAKIAALPCLDSDK
jgi:hypothetical protein